MNMDINLNITDSNGNLLNYTVLLTFDANNKSYVVYTDADLDTDTEVNVYYASYKTGTLSKLEPIVDQNEIQLIDSVVEDYEDDIRKMSENI